MARFLFFGKIIKQHFSINSHDVVLVVDDFYYVNVFLCNTIISSLKADMWTIVIKGSFAEKSYFVLKFRVTVSDCDDFIRARILFMNVTQYAAIHWSLKKQEYWLTFQMSLPWLLLTPFLHSLFLAAGGSVWIIPMSSRKKINCDITTNRNYSTICYCWLTRAM